jgi:flagellar hook-associated protein 3 FlgL
MSGVSIGDLATSFRQRALNADLRQAATRVSFELASGRAQDVAKKLGAGLDGLAATQRKFDMLGAYQRSAAELAVWTAGQQEALDVLQTATETSGSRALTAANTQTATAIDAAALSATQDFAAAIAALNTQTSGRSLFSGRTFDRPALVSATEILDQLEPLLAGETTATGVAAIIDNYFNLPGGGFEAAALIGSTLVAGPVRIAESESVGTGVTAADAKLRRALQGLASAALLTRGTLEGDMAERSTLLRSAGETMLSASSDVTDLRAGIGSVQERLEAIGIRNTASLTVLETQLNQMLSVDGFEAATRLQRIEASLEALYISTARLSQMSLTRYL